MKIKNALLLFLAATIWGLAFSAQSMALDYVGPFTVNCVRCIVGGTFLIPCILLLEKMGFVEKKQQTPEARKNLMIGGIACGIVLGVASSLQQIGIMHTTVGKAGFITTFYIIMVPIIGLFFHKKCGLNIWVGVILALAGLYFLCFNEQFVINPSDAIVFLCALVFSIHILVIDHYSPLVDGVKLSCIQFFVAGVFCGIPMLIFEQPDLMSIFMGWKPILYLGVMSCGLGYTLQIVGQKDVDPTIASLILSMESVMSVVGGAILLHQRLSGREILGCILMFIAIIIAQLPGKKKHNVR